MKTLTPIQEAGAEFLATTGVLLADPPGAGKTLQAIEACKRVGARRVLVICPAVALGVWRDEVNDCWPGCTPIYLRDIVASPPGADNRPQVVITGPEYLVVNDAAKAAIVGMGRFDVLIWDEAQAGKSPTAKRTMLVYGPGCAGGGVASLADRVWLLSGTIILNHAGEIWPHLRALAPGRIEQKSYAGFTARYCTTKIRTVRSKRGRSVNIEVIDGSNREALPDLARRLRGFWLRRDIDDQLPALRIVPRALPPDACNGEILATVEHSEEAELLRKAIAAGDPEALKAVEGQVSRLRRLLALAKVEATISWIEDLFEQGVVKVVCFGWHVEALERISAGLAKHGAVTITGATASGDGPGQRGRIVQQFQRDPATRVFVGQIQAAGTAITLTAANRVVLFECAWTPALNYQAIRRTHRIGQTKPVLAEVLAVEGSIDYAVNEILARKSAEIALLENEGAE